MNTLHQSNVKIDESIYNYNLYSKNICEIVINYTNLLVSFRKMFLKGKVLLLFLALFNELESANKYCNPCITILPTDGYDDGLAGTYRF